jgi:hypothetical protein
MAQGTRGRWIRAASAGFGVMLCTGLVGCMNWDKPKDTAKTKPGLPGTPTLPQNNGAASGVSNNKAFQQPAGQQPGFATGTTGGPFRMGTNTNTAGTGQNWNNGPAQPGYPGGIGAPTLTGPSASPSVLPAGGPAGGPVGAAPYQNPGHQNTGAGYSALSSPPPPQLDIVPPPPPVGHGAHGTEIAGTGSVLPPVPTGSVAPLAPIPPPGVAPTSPGRGNF